MKKILLLLLIAPVLGFGQQLYFNPNSLQLTDVFSFTSFESQNTTMTVPQGKIWFIKTNLSNGFTFLLNGIPINRWLRPVIAWYGDMDLKPHLLKLVSLRSIKIKLIYIKPVCSSNFASRKDLSNHLEKKIKKIYSSSFSKKLAK